MITRSTMGSMSRVISEGATDVCSVIFVPSVYPGRIENRRRRPGRYTEK